MAAAKYKLKIEQGATLRKPFTWKSAGLPVDITGWTARMQARETIDSQNVIFELTTENGGIIIGPEVGQFWFYMPDTDSAALSFESAVYDLNITDHAGDVIRLLHGDVELSLGVTRANAP